MYEITEKIARYIKRMKIGDSLRKNKKGASCKTFCQRDYGGFLDKHMEAMHKKYNMPYVKPTDVEKKEQQRVCMKSYCNKTCKGYPEQRPRFHEDYTQSEQKMILSRGAKSACIVDDYYWETLQKKKGGTKKKSGKHKRKSSKYKIKY